MAVCRPNPYLFSPNILFRHSTIRHLTISFRFDSSIFPRLSIICVCTNGNLHGPDLNQFALSNCDVLRLLAVLAQSQAWHPEYRCFRDDVTRISHATLHLTHHVVAQIKFSSSWTLVVYSDPCSVNPMPDKYQAQQSFRRSLYILADLVEKVRVMRLPADTCDVG